MFSGLAPKHSEYMLRCQTLQEHQSPHLNHKHGLPIMDTMSGEGDDAHKSDVDEADAYFEFTKNEGTSCKDVFQWWRAIGKSRFSNMSRLAVTVS